MEENDIYTKISELAELQFTVCEISIIIEKEPDFFDKNQKALKAFLKGRLSAQAEVRKAMLQMAKQGSTPAQKEFQKLSEESYCEIE